MDGKGFQAVTTVQEIKHTTSAVKELWRHSYKRRNETNNPSSEHTLFVLKREMDFKRGNRKNS